MLKRLLRSAVTAYVVMFSLVGGGQWALHQQDQRGIHANCMLSQREWDTFSRLIDAAVHSPSQAGRQLTAAQKAALAAYRDSLRQSIGPRPGC